MIFDADLSSIDAGVWRDFEGSKFLIAHISNMKFQRELSRLQQPHRRKIQENSLDPKTNQDIICQAMSKCVLLDWKDVVTKSGEAVTFSSDKALELLKRNPEFRDWVSEVAMAMANFRAEEVAEMGEG